MRQSGAETLVTEEPYALIAHVRVCGGAGWVTTGSTRKPTPNSLRLCLAPALARGSPPALGARGAERNPRGKPIADSVYSRLLGGGEVLFIHICLEVLGVFVVGV